MRPHKAGICLELARRAAGRAPLLGVCLGHQAIAQAFGARIVRAPTPMHGKLSDIRHRGGPLFAGLPSPFEATRYHSLTVEPESLPDAFEVTADAADGTIMAISHRELPLHGVQFHPESIASEYGHEVLANFLDIAGVRRRRAGPRERRDGRFQTPARPARVGRSSWRAGGLRGVRHHDVGRRDGGADSAVS